MKKLFLFTAIFLQTSIFCFSEEETPKLPEQQPNGTPISIKIPNPELDQNDKGRSMFDIPISGVYYNSTFTFTFLQSLGNVSITIINTSTSVVEVQEEVDSSLGACDCIVSGDYGVYDITIVDAWGNTYVAEFENL